MNEIKPEQSDPRVYFAAERTLLAWVRSGIAVIGLGFVIARFGLFLKLVRGADGGPHRFSGTNLIGVALVLLGSVSIALAARQHRRYIGRLSQKDLPESYSTGWASTFSFGIAATGMLLTAYLFLSSVP